MYYIAGVKSGLFTPEGSKDSIEYHNIFVVKEEENVRGKWAGKLKCSPEVAAKIPVDTDCTLVFDRFGKVVDFN